jgi:hypothetical protein
MQGRDKEVLSEIRKERPRSKWSVKHEAPRRPREVAMQVRNHSAEINSASGAGPPVLRHVALRATIVQSIYPSV